MEERIIELETKTAYQDRIIEELNEIVTAREKRIEKLEKRLDALARRLGEITQSFDGGPVEDPPPPHY